MKSYAKEQRMPTLQEIANDLCEDDEIQYVVTKSKVGVLEKIEVGTADSIYTKLNEYPYEFEINSSLQLASVDGENIIKPTTITNDELLIEGEPIIVNTTNAWTTLNKDFTIKPISEYKYILFTFGCINELTGNMTSKKTLLLPVDESIYGTNGYIILDADDGMFYSTAIIYIMDDHTIRIFQTISENTNRKRFAITSIKGIK